MCSASVPGMKTTDAARQQVGREKWAKLVERWQQSGLSTSDFAAQAGVNPRTLSYWRWMLAREQSAEAPKRAEPNARRGREANVLATARRRNRAVSFVEVLPTPVAQSGFELELRSGAKLRLPWDFDAVAVRRLLSILEAP